MLFEYAASRGYAVCSVGAAEHFHRTRWWAARKLRKLVKMGLLSQWGRTRCCFQKYVLRNDVTLPMSSTRILEHLLDLFCRKHPTRIYFNIRFVVATLQSPYATSRDVSRPYGRSVSYGSHDVGDLWSMPSFSYVWVPSEVFDSVAFYLNESGVVWHLEDYVPSLFMLGNSA